MIFIKEKYDKTEYYSFEWCGYHMNRDVLNYDFKHHKHDFYEAFFIIDGCAKHFIGSYSYPVKRGDVFVIKGDVAHGFYEVEDMDIINAMYYPDMFVSTEQQLSNLPGFQPLFLIEPEIRMYSHYPYVLSLDDKDLAFVVMIADFIIQELEKKQRTIISW